MTTEAPSRPRRTRRLGLYLPVLLLLLLAVGWSAGWFFIRGRVTTGLDEWISKEATAGRRWTCADRTVTGYPFRIEIRCSDFSLDRPDVTASIGKLTVVSQVYRPRHIIAEASGPMRVKAGTTEADGRWKQLRSSVLATDNSFELIDIVAVEPVVSVHEQGGIPFDLISKRFEGHLRPKPGDPTSIDLWAKSEGAVIPGLDVLIGGTGSADLTLDVTVTQTDDLPARPLWSELERWRNAGGVVTLKSLKLAKGTSQRLEVTGQVSIDAEHRPEGQFDLTAAGLGGVLGQLTSGTGGLLGALLGGGQPAPKSADGAPLTRLPPLQVRNGRLSIGPIVVPGVRIPSLY